MNLMYIHLETSKTHSKLDYQPNLKILVDGQGGLLVCQ